MWYVYLLSNRAHTIYVGCPNQMLRRFREHMTRRSPFTGRYTFNRLVYYELQPSRFAAEKRERQIKAWSRTKKVMLIQSMNPQWRNLAWKLSKAAIDAQR